MFTGIICSIHIKLNFKVICICIVVWYVVPGRSSCVENLLEMSEKAKLADQDLLQLMNGLVDKLQNADLKRNALFTRACLTKIKINF